MVACVVVFSLFSAFYFTLSTLRIRGLHGGTMVRDSAQNAVSLLQGIVGSVLALWVIGALDLSEVNGPHWHDQFDDVNGDVRFYTRLTLQATFGYMVADTFLTVYATPTVPRKGRTAHMLILVHHVLVVVTFGICEQTSLGAYVPGLLQVAELTNPLLHLHWFLERTEAHPTLCLAVASVFGMLFLLVRGVFYVWVLVGPMRAFVFYPPPGAIERWGVWYYFPAVLGFGFTLLNLHWCHLVILKAKRVAAGTDGTHEKVKKEA
jgi:hypothetical protein